MIGCHIGRNFQVTVAGGSYQDGLSAILQGHPPGMLLTEQKIYGDLLLRKPGADELSSPRKEPDLPIIYSGLNAADTIEGVGSYWPFATGRIVDHANLLLRQIVSTPKVRYTLIPNQHVGAWETSFMPQWISREYLARRGAASFRPYQLTPARCPLLGYAFNTMQVEGVLIPQWLLQINMQPEVGTDGYDKGAKILQDFFERELRKFLHPDLNPLGGKIITCCLDGGVLQDFDTLLHSVSV